MKIASILTALISILVSTSAAAGTLQLHDNLGVLTPVEKQAIKDAATASPNDYAILIDRAASKDELDNIVHLMIDSPRTIGIGVDPDHRYIRVNFGTATGIPSSDYGRVSSSGNGSFKVKSWGDGMVEVIHCADSLRRAPVVRNQISDTTPAVNDTVTIHQQADTSSGIGTFFFWLLVIAFVCAVIYLVVRYRGYGGVSSTFVDPPDEYPYPSTRTRTGYAPVRQVLPSSTHTTVIQQGGSNDLAVGMLIGDQLGRDRGYAAPATPAAPVTPRSPDAGGSSSSFDAPVPPAPRYVPPAYTPPPRRPSTPKPSSSYDSGGSSSSWGSSDSGGGFDGGGSGSDF